MFVLVILSAFFRDITRKIIATQTRMNVRKYIVLCLPIPGYKGIVRYLDNDRLVHRVTLQFLAVALQ